MKANRCAVFVENKSGHVYQVALTKEEQSVIMLQLLTFHNGKIKVFQKMEGMEFEPKGKNK